MADCLNQAAKLEVRPEASGFSDGLHRVAGIAGEACGGHEISCQAVCRGLRHSTEAVASSAIDSWRTQRAILQMGVDDATTDAIRPRGYARLVFRVARPIVRNVHRWTAHAQAFLY